MKLDLFKFTPNRVGNTAIEKRVNKSHLNLIFKFKDNQKSKLKLRRFVNQNIFMFGLGLFAGEGSKKLLQGNPNFVEFINSEPNLILLFLDFLNELGFGRERLKARVQISCKSSETNHKIKESTKFWISLTGIPEKNFVKPNVRVREHPKQKSIYGALCIRLFSQPLWRLLVNWIKDRKWIARGGISGT